MDRPQHIDFFELSDKILERLNTNGNLKLTHQDISLKLQRDTYYPSDKFNIELYVFDEMYSHAYYTVDYCTVDKIIGVLFAHAVDDYGYIDERHGVILLKRASLENKLAETIKESGTIIENKYGKERLPDLHIFIEEQYPYDHLDEKGLPFFELNFYSKNNAIDIKILLAFNSSDFMDKPVLLQELQTKI